MHLLRPLYGPPLRHNLQRVGRLKHTVALQWSRSRYSVAAQTCTGGNLRSSTQHFSTAIPQEAADCNSQHEHLGSSYGGSGACMWRRVGKGPHACSASCCIQGSPAITETSSWHRPQAGPWNPRPLSGSAGPTLHPHSCLLPRYQLQDTQPCV